MSKYRYKKVLLVDDSSVDNYIHKKIIELYHFAVQVITTTNGEEAINYLKSLKNPDELPEFIFLDINMPIMNGHAFLSEFDNFPESFKSRCKVVVISSSGEERDMKVFKEYPFVVDYFIKPFTDKMLQSLSYSKKTEIKKPIS